MGGLAIAAETATEYVELLAQTCCTALPNDVVELARKAALDARMPARPPSRICKQLRDYIEYMPE